MLKLQAPVKLDLACGQHKQDGFLGVDQIACEGVDLTCDLSQTPWHFYDARENIIPLGQVLNNNSVEEVYCSHFFEHLDGMERIAFMNELWRVMMPHHQAIITVPYGMSIRALQDPTHKWPPVVESSFLYFTEPWRIANGLDHYPIHCNFWITYDIFYPEEWQLRNDETRNFALRHYNNVVSDLRAYVTKLEMGEEGPPTMLEYEEVAKP